MYLVISEKLATSQNNYYLLNYLIILKIFTKLVLENFIWFDT